MESFLDISTYIIPQVCLNVKTRERVMKHTIEKEDMISSSIFSHPIDLASGLTVKPLSPGL